MYSCYTPYLVYGFTEGNSTLTWVCDKYPNIRTFTREIIRNYGCESIYGIKVNFNPKTGEINIDSKKKAEVDAAFEKVYKYKISIDYSKNKDNMGVDGILPKLGYYVAMIGDYDLTDDSATYHI